MAKPERVERLVLAAFTYTGAGSPTLARRAEQVAAYRASNRRLRDRAMIRSIFSRDGHGGGYDPVVAEAIADEELAFGNEVPTGTYLDMVANLPVVDPKQGSGAGAAGARRARRHRHRSTTSTTSTSSCRTATASS